MSASLLSPPDALQARLAAWRHGSRASAARHAQRRTDNAAVAVRVQEEAVRLLSEGVCASLDTLPAPLRAALGDSLAWASGGGGGGVCIGAAHTPLQADPTPEQQLQAEYRRQAAATLCTLPHAYRHEESVAGGTVQPREVWEARDLGWVFAQSDAQRGGPKRRRLEDAERRFVEAAPRLPAAGRSLHRAGLARDGELRCLRERLRGGWAKTAATLATLGGATAADVAQRRTVAKPKVGEGSAVSQKSVREMARVLGQDGGVGDVAARAVPLQAFCLVSEASQEVLLLRLKYWYLLKLLRVSEGLMQRIGAVPVLRNYDERAKRWTETEQDFLEFGVAPRLLRKEALELAYSKAAPAFYTMKQLTHEADLRLDHHTAVHRIMKTHQRVLYTHIELCHYEKKPMVIAEPTGSGVMLPLIVHAFYGHEGEGKRKRQRATCASPALFILDEADIPSFVEQLASVSGTASQSLEGSVKVLGKVADWNGTKAAKRLFTDLQSFKEGNVVNGGVLRPMLPPDATEGAQWTANHRGLVVAKELFQTSYAWREAWMSLSTASFHTLVYDMRRQSTVDVSGDLKTLLHFGHCAIKHRVLVTNVHPVTDTPSLDHLWGIASFFFPRFFGPATTFCDPLGVEQLPKKYGSSGDFERARKHVLDTAFDIVVPAKEARTDPCHSEIFTAVFLQRLVASRSFVPLTVVGEGQADVAKAQKTVERAVRRCVGVHRSEEALLVARLQRILGPFVWSRPRSFLAPFLPDSSRFQFHVVVPCQPSPFQTALIRTLAEYFVDSVSAAVVHEQSPRDVAALRKRSLATLRVVASCISKASVHPLCLWRRWQRVLADSAKNHAEQSRDAEVVPDEVPASLECWKGGTGDVASIVRSSGVVACLHNLLLRLDSCLSGERTHKVVIYVHEVETYQILNTCLVATGEPSEGLLPKGFFGNPTSKQSHPRLFFVSKTDPAASVAEVHKRFEQPRTGLMVMVMHGPVHLNLALADTLILIDAHTQHPDVELVLGFCRGLTDTVSLRVVCLSPNLAPTTQSEPAALSLLQEACTIEEAERTSRQPTAEERDADDVGFDSAAKLFTLHPYQQSCYVRLAEERLKAVVVNLARRPASDATKNVYTELPAATVRSMALARRNTKKPLAPEAVPLMHYSEIPGILRGPESARERTAQLLPGVAQARMVEVQKASAADTEDDNLMGITRLMRPGFRGIILVDTES
eukprot:Rhum_TRINITY_DN14717_c17_g1::Rhum_TRINITY_DN14717_c17_g1_i2::g.114050::m.114050